MSRLAEKEHFRKTISELIALFRSPDREQSFVGSRQGPTLEHTTRRHFIDPFLRALGWDLSRLSREIIEEARVHGETTLRLDYLGVNQDTRIPLFIVEAKPWGAPFVAPSALEASTEGKEASQPISLICAAIEHCKNGGLPKDSPVTREWTEYLSKLLVYVTNVRDESGHIVNRLALISGQWLVTFNDPEAIFLTPGPFNQSLVKVYRGDELVSYAEIIFEQLACSSIADTFPELIRPTLLPAYIRSSDVSGIYRALWVSRQEAGASWRPRPSLDFEVALVIERRDGALLTVVDQSIQGYSMPYDSGELTIHIANVGTASDELLQRVNSELQMTSQPYDVSTFPGFPQRDFVGNRVQPMPNNQGTIALTKLVGKPGEFLLVTGAAKHFLLLEPTVNPCPCHDWVFCQEHDVEQGTNPILSRSVDPPAFFISREVHHCANRTVHDRRNPRCQIDAFEKFLCCRACTLQNFCWKSQELMSLPCGKSVTVASG